MKTLVAVLLAMTLAGSLAAQDHSAHAAAAKPATMMTGMGDLHHPVSTKNADAQAFFDQGLRLIYAFNHDEAARSFQRAADLDPKLAMAYWGIAEAVGPNYNDPASEERFKQAHDAIQKAVDLSAGASPAEQDYINAMAKRFPADPKADLRKAAEAYHDAMREVAKKYPDDLDAATLFAESGMNLHPWGLWLQDGTPREGTEEIVATLEGVIKRDPNHMGAVHYYIHAVEASNTPERALAGANRLAALAPAAGHLVHMPAHVYIRTGDYDAAVDTNEKAAAADRDYMKASGGQPNMYSLMYYSHNLHFIAIAGSINGEYEQSKKGCRHAGRKRRAAREGHAAARSVPGHSHGSQRPLSEVGRHSRHTSASRRSESSHCLLALLSRHGAGRQRQNGRRGSGIQDAGRHPRCNSCRSDFRDAFQQ